MRKICLKLKNGLGLEEKIYKKRDKFPILWYTFCKVKSVYILKANFGSSFFIPKCLIQTAILLNYYIFIVVDTIHNLL